MEGLYLDLSKKMLFTQNRVRNTISESKND